MSRRQGNHPLLSFMVTLGVLLAACDTPAAPTTTLPPLPPPDPQIVSTTTVPPPRPTTPSSFTDSGFLPDGTRYVIHIEGLDVGFPSGASAGIVMDIGGSPNAVGIAQFFAHGNIADYSYDDGLYRIPGSGGAQVDFYDHVLDALGPDAESAIRSSIVAGVPGFPVLVLSSPFRWATDEDLPLAMEVYYQDFVIRRGCGDLAAACSQNRAVQVIPIDSVSMPASVWADLEVTIESTGRRSVSDPNYLDPGPMSPRTIPDVLWNGEEMIIWGGGQSGEPYLIDGATFHPETGEWDMLPPIPLSGEQPTRSIWVDGRLLVISNEGTFALERGAATWVDVESAGVQPPREPGYVVLYGRDLVLWNTSGFFELDLDSPGSGWRELPDPPFEPGNARSGDNHFSAMIISGETLYAAQRSDDRCTPREIARWDGSSWRLLSGFEFVPFDFEDCSSAHQMAAIPGGIVIWDLLQHSTLIYSPELDAWSPADPLPISAGGDRFGAVIVDDHRFVVAHDGRGALFDARSEAWTALDLPGSGDEASIVWTGTEFLAWGIWYTFAWYTFDAWRWTPSFDG